MIDIVREIDAIHRSVGTAPLGDGEGHAVRISRTYDSPIEDVWDALTTPERISRWFLPISGDYRLGGRYQLEGNAGGEIVDCERPRRLKVTWEYGPDAGPASEVELRLSPAEAGSTTVELEHVAIVPDEMWDQFGPGAVGVGWDGGVLGLGLHLRGGSVSRSDRVAAVRGGTGVGRSKQRRLGRRLRGVRRGSGGRRDGCREYHRLLRAGPRDACLTPS